MVKKGILISFEGGEGSGKTVQIKRLRDRLEKAGKEVLVTREPGGTVIAEQIRKVILDKKNIGMAYTTEVLLFQAARAQIYRELVLPSLKAGKIVLADRTRDSSTVYQGIVRGFGRKPIETLNDISTRKTYPDLTIYLDVPVEVGLKRRSGTKKVDRLDLEKKEFHQKVRQAYLKLARENDRRRWVKIDGTKSIEEVEEEIGERIRERFGFC